MKSSTVVSVGGVSRERRRVRVPMRDGVVIAADAYGVPEAGAKPAILIRIPYVKGITSSGIMLNSPWATVGADGVGVMSPAGADPGRDLMAVTIGALVDAGYVVVVGDTRGTGFAEGRYDYYNLVDGADDGYDTVEWLAQQAWCTGDVGLWGCSAGGVLAYLTAVKRPPHLKTMVAGMVPSDFYHDQWFPGGLFRLEDRMRWIMGMQLATGLLDPRSYGEDDQHGRSVMRERYRESARRLADGLSPVDLDWAVEAAAHTGYDDYWKRRSLRAQLDRVNVPVLNFGVLFDHFIAGTLYLDRNLGVERRLHVLPGSLDAAGVAGDGGLLDDTITWFHTHVRGESPVARPRARLPYRRRGVGRSVSMALQSGHLAPDLAPGMPVTRRAFVAADERDIARRGPI